MEANPGVGPLHTRATPCDSGGGGPTLLLPHHSAWRLLPTAGYGDSHKGGVCLWLGTPIDDSAL